MKQPFVSNEVPVGRVARPRHITRLVTHAGPHADEELAYLQMQYFGRDHFTIDPKVQVCYVSIYLTPEMISGFGSDTEFLGVGKGSFDDHGPLHKKSCCELMAEHLGVRDHPSLIKLIDAVARLDKEKSSSKAMTLPRLMSLAHRYGRTPEAVREWVRIAFKAIIEQEDAFLTLVRERNHYIRDYNRFDKKVTREFLEEPRPWADLELDVIADFISETKRREWVAFYEAVEKEQATKYEQALEFARKEVRTYKTTSGRKRLLIVDGTGAKKDSYHLELDAAARNMGVQADFVVLRNPAGNTMIVANKGANLLGLVEKIRKAECDKRGIKIAEDRLSLEGTLEECPWWHLHEGIGGCRFYNGTTTRADIEQTWLTLEDILTLLWEWLGVSRIIEPKTHETNVTSKVASAA